MFFWPGLLKKILTKHRTIGIDGMALMLADDWELSERIYFLRDQTKANTLLASRK